MARSAAIIAVFGGSTDVDKTYKTYLKLAYEIGSVIAKRNRILLTGGEGPREESEPRPESETVKEKAIDGALSINTSAPWLGVTRKGGPGFIPSGSGGIIRTNLDHGRNYLEACLCDGAIGLAGGDGTLSEVTFTMALGKPVVLVGEVWEEDPLETRVPEIVRRSFRRVGARGENKELDELLNEAKVLQSMLEQPPAPKYLSLDDGGLQDTAEKAVQFIIDSLGGSEQLMGDFPDLSEYDEVQNDYRAWLGERES